MPERLELTKNVLFFKTVAPIDDNAISEILDEAVENKETGSNFIIDNFRYSESTNLNVDYKVSIKVFPTVRPVYFLDDDNFEDRIYAFIIIIELNNYLVVLSKSCSSFLQVLKEKFDLIQVSDLSKLLRNDAEFQKMSLRNMTVSDKAIRSRSYESGNLIGTLSTHAAGRSIPSHFKVREGGNTKSISGTGRVVESSARQSINDIVNWADTQINLLTTANQNDFLNLFAKKVLLKDVLMISKPSALLIDISSIEDKILDGSLQLKYEVIKKEVLNGKKKRSKKIINITDRIQAKLILELGKVYEIDSNLDLVGYKSSSKIKKNKKTLSISSNLLRKIKVEENNKLESFMGYINKHGLFSITFDDPKYMYFMDNCFEDVSGVAEIESILEILHPQINIEKVLSEKGAFINNQIAFDNDSMFGFVEKTHANDDYIFCDDLGDEWADHITLNLTDPSISFIHSKHGDVSTSASNLHDVVGQGIKNLGNMFFSKNQINQKVTLSLANHYKCGKGVQTQIARIRKSTPNFDTDIDSLFRDHKLHRKCILSCSFISKTAITVEFNKLKNGQKVRGNIVQLLWILSSFAHAAKDVNVIPMIYCAA